MGYSYTKSKKTRKIKKGVHKINTVHSHYKYSVHKYRELASFLSKKYSAIKRWSRRYSYLRSKRKTQINNGVDKVVDFNWKYRNLLMLILSFLLASYLVNKSFFISFLDSLGHYGYLSSFITGLLFAYAFTSAPAAAGIFVLGKSLNPIPLAAIGAFGAVLSDYLIFRFVRDRLMDEINLLYHDVKKVSRQTSMYPFFSLTQEIRIMLWNMISKSKIWHYLIPVIAGLIIASPLPDELGVAIFGAVKFQPKKFLVASYFLNFIGILVIASLSRF